MSEVNEAQKAEVTEKPTKAPRVKKPKLDAEGQPIVKAVRVAKPKPEKQPRQIKDSSIAVLNFLNTALASGPATKNSLWKEFKETHPDIILKPAAFGSIAKRAVYSGKFIVTGDKAESLALAA